MLHFTNNYDVYVSDKSHNLNDLLHIEQKISMYSYYINITKLMINKKAGKKQEKASALGASTFLYASMMHSLTMLILSMKKLRRK